MAHLKIGDPAPVFVCDSQHGEGVPQRLSRSSHAPRLQQVLRMPRLPDRVRRAPGVHPCSPRFAGPLCQPIQARLREDLHRGEGRRLPHITAEKRRDRYPLYDLYGVAGFGPVSAAQILLKGRKAMQLGKVHGLYEGIEGQCPALFLVASDGTIAMTPYGLFDPGKITETLSRLS